MPISDNPAARLLRLLEAGRAIPPNTTSFEVWANLLRVPKEDTGAILELLGRVVVLPAEVRKEIESSPGVTAETYLKWLPKVERALSQLNFHATWDTFIKHIDDETILGLEICSDVLKRRCVSLALDEDELTLIHDDVRDLVETVLRAEIDVAIKDFIVRHLRELENAIFRYRVNGAAPIERAVQSAVGAGVLKDTVRQQTQANEFGERFWKVMGRVAFVLSVANNGYDLASDVAMALLPASVEGAETTPLPSGSCEVDVDVLDVEPIDGEPGSV